MLSLCSLCSHHSTLARLASRSRFELPASPALLASLTASPLLACALASLAPAASPVCFACSLRSTRLSRCSLCSSSLPLPSLASLGPLLLFARAPLAASPDVLSPRSSARLLLGARSARRLDCGSLRSPLAAPPAAHFRLTSLAVYLLDLLAHLNDCPPRLAHLACSIIFCAGAQLKSPLSFSV